MKKYTFSLCEDCEQCPVVKVESDKVSITDDYGGKVLLTKGQIAILSKNLK